VGGALGASVAATVATAAEPENAIQLGRLDLREISAVDAHVHPPGRRTPGEAPALWGRSFASAALVAGGDFEAAASTDLVSGYSDLVRDLPFSAGLRNYVARRYDVSPELAAVDAVVKKQFDRGPAAYFRRKMDEERIETVVLQSTGVEPARPTGFFPDERVVWTYSISPLIQPAWANAQAIVEIDDYARRMSEIVTSCAANGCVGIKLPIAYYRPIAVERVARVDAQEALDRILGASPAAMRQEPTPNPEFADPSLRASLWQYQDYLLRNLFLLAGELDLKIIIHSAVAVHPGLRWDYNDPRSLYEIIADPDVLAARTRFVLVHAGYPQHHAVGALLSQFPSVFADLSFFSHHPGALEEIVRTFLGFAPFGKVMHGSDWSSPEEIGYAVDNVRRILAKVVRDYTETYGWSTGDGERIARDILGDTARRLFKIA
jgi:predicted TIM-barrel fold metal-dependent hydrolase